MNSGEQFAEALRAASPEGAIRPPAADSKIGQIEMRFGVRLPKDITWFYRTMNGMDWPTRPDNGWIRIWDLESWQRVRNEPSINEEALYPDLQDAILLADHCDSSWFYAGMFSPAHEGVRIYLVDGLRPAKLVEDTFTAFVNSALADAADIYPDAAG
jgi:SMI1 / KNR4 family (SUKH-1)